MKLKTTLIFFLFACCCQAQENNILERLTAMSNEGIMWYDIDGYSVNREILDYAFDESGVKKALKSRKISNKLPKTRNSTINRNNWFISSQNTHDSLIHTDNCYLVENSNKTITLIHFSKIGTTDADTEERLVNTIIDSIIPQSNIVPMNFNSINFAGRTVPITAHCYWTMLNSVQCPSRGQMNWSIHRTIEGAQEAIDNQLEITRYKKGGTVTSEELVNVTFEGVSTQAKKVIFTLKGFNSALLSATSGAKALTIYYIAATVRDKNVSCVFSFWNSDMINPQTKLPPLVEKFMVLVP